MDVKLIVAIFVFAVAPVCAHAQTPSDAKVTKADVQRVVKMITDDKTKAQTYCEIAKVGVQIDEAEEKKDTKKAEDLSQKMDGLAKKLGPEYGALMDGLQDIDPESQDGREMSAMFAGLNKLCAK
jgi:hypothetical protein